MKRIYEYDGYILFGEKYKDDLSDDVLYRYEYQKPDGTTDTIDVYPLVQVRDLIFRKFVDSGCPSRYNLKSLEPMTATDIEIYYHEKMQSLRKRVDIS